MLFLTQINKAQGLPSVVNIRAMYHMKFYATSRPGNLSSMILGLNLTA